MPMSRAVPAIVAVVFALLSTDSALSAEEPDTARTARNGVPHLNHAFLMHRPVVERLKPEDFIIMPWGWTPDDPEVLNGMWECGFNTAGFVAPHQVPAVKQARLKCIVDGDGMEPLIHDVNLPDEEVQRHANALAAKFLHEDAVLGYYIKDEPSSPFYPNLARWSQAFRKADPSKFCYINLLPMGAQDPGVKDYGEYVEKFYEAVKPPFLSYDRYSLHDDGTPYASLSHGYFQNLEFMRDASLRHKVPFWNIVLGNTHFRYAIPTETTIRFQTYTTLAYGARGLAFFTYMAPIVGNYRGAAVDQFHNKTATWDILRNNNLQIHQLGPTYIQLESVNVFHHPEVPPECRGIDTSRHIKTVEGGSFVVGEFVHKDGTPYVMVVNKSLKESCAVGVQFKEEGTVMITSPYTGLTIPLGGENVWLAPGQGVLLSVAGK